MTLKSVGSYDLQYTAKNIENVIRLHCQELHPNGIKDLGVPFFNFYYDEYHNLMVFEVRLNHEIIFQKGGATKSAYRTSRDSNTEDFFFVDFLEYAFSHWFGWKEPINLFTESVMKKLWTAKYDNINNTTTLQYKIYIPCINWRSFFVCSTFSFYQPHSIFASNDEKDNTLNREFPYTGGDDFEIWFCTEHGNILKDPQVHGHIVLELHVDKRV